MRDLPVAIIQVLRPFERVFSDRVWEWVNILLVGAILAPGKRTVTTVLRVMGLSNERQFQNYHRVLNRATWSSRTVSQILLRLLLRAFVPADAPVVVGLDEHIERRRGAKIAAKGTRCGALQQVLLGQGQWPALGLHDAVGHHSLGPVRVGLAIFDGVGTFRAVSS